MSRLPTPSLNRTELIGSPVSQLDTPVLIVDLDRLESNIAEMAGYCYRFGTAWRPHSKANKCPEIAQLQIDAGARGVTCAKLSEAEMMVANGIGDILLANQMASAQKQQRLAEVQKQGRVIGIVDTAQVLEPMSNAADQAGTTIPILIDVDIGMARTGCQPGAEVVRLAEVIAGKKGLRLEGIMGYEGHTIDIASASEKESACSQALESLILSRDALSASGFRCDIVSAGGTGTYAITAAFEGITEIQAGGGIFMDAMYRDKCQVQDLGFALTILAIVTSRQAGHIVIDAGFKTLSSHHEAPRPLNRDDLEFRYLSAEHGVFDVREGHAGPQIGERIELLVGYSDSTTFLHDSFVGVREGLVECFWEIQGRGLLT